MLNFHSHRSLALTAASALLTLAPMTSAQVEDLGIDDVDKFFLSSTGEAGAGQRRRADGLGEAFRWRADGTVEALLTPTGVRGTATAVSDDGNFVCGLAIGPGAEKRAIRWDVTGLPLDIAWQSSPINIPVAMSRDGQTIALETRASNGAKLAAVWAPTGGVVTIPPPPGFLQSEIIDLSQDGSTAIGRYSIDDSFFSPTESFLWSSTTGTTTFAGPGNDEVALNNLSADGTVVTGTTKIGGQPVIFRWTAAGGFQVLPEPFEFIENVQVSADGNTLYGVNLYAAPGSSQFFTWTQANGFETYMFDAELVPGGISGDGSLMAATLGPLGQTSADPLRWTRASGFEALDSFGGNTFATSITLDGSVIGGTRMTGNGGRAVIWRADGKIGEAYCGPGVPNSTGSPSEMSLTGSNISEHVSMTLQATGLPPSSFGFFMASQSDGFVATPGGSQGNLCLSGTIGSFVGTGQIGNSGSTGTLSMTFDPRFLPGPNGPILWTFGERWFFQAWHRDANPGATSNFSDAVTVRIY